MTVKVTGSVRVDLVGGTLDLNPINLILKDVVTMNVATSLMAQVKLTKIDEDHILFLKIMKAKISFPYLHLQKRT